MRVLLLCASFCSSVIAASAWGSEDPALPLPEEIVRRAFENLYGFDSIQQVEIASGPTSGERFFRSAQVIRAMDSEGMNRMLIRFTGPPDMRGVSLLLKERDNHQYDSFIYQPLVKKVRRVSMYQRHDKFFGTDLAFEDLEGKRPERWNSELLRHGSETGREAWVIRLTPDNFPSGYDSIIGWFDRDIPIMTRVECYRNQKRIKVIEIDAGRVIKRGEYHIPTEFTITSQDDSMTRVSVSEVEILELTDTRLFTISSLESGSVRREASSVENSE